MSEVLLRLLSKDFQKNLYPDNAFYKMSKLDAVGNGVKIVEIPIAGSVPGTITDPAVFPLATVERVDLEQTYSLSEIATEPTLLRFSNEMITAYDKRAELIEDHKMAIQTQVARAIVQAWAPASTALVTSGTSTRAASAPSATGNRKKMVKADFLQVFTAMNLDNIPDDGNRYGLLCPEMYEDLLDVADFIDYNKTGNTDAISKGILGEIVGIKIMKRSSMPIYDTSGNLKAIGAAGATTDNLSSIFWHRSFVRHAETPAKVFMDLDKPQYLGSIFNVSVMTGGVKSRTDGKGVYAVRQTS